MPGITLPAGTYVFRFPLKQDLAGPGSQPVIQVLRPDGGDSYAMFHAIPIRDASRTLATDEYEVKWREQDDDAPPAVEALFLPGQSTGFEFLYKSSS